MDIQSKITENLQFCGHLRGLGLRCGGACPRTITKFIGPAWPLQPQCLYRGAFNRGSRCTRHRRVWNDWSKGTGRRLLEPACICVSSACARLCGLQTTNGTTLSTTCFSEIFGPSRRGSARKCKKGTVTPRIAASVAGTHRRASSTFQYSDSAAPFLILLLEVLPLAPLQLVTVPCTALVACGPPAD